MNHLPTSNLETVRLELSRLYEKRLIVDELIRNLERYAEYESRPSVTVPKPAGSAESLPFLSQ
jgi:hypothetical protein